MSCTKHKALLERWWNDRLTGAERVELEARLTECEDCRHELEGSRELWELMGYVPVPEPSEEMQVQFNAMLEGYKVTQEGRKRVAGIRSGIAAFWQVFAIRPWIGAAFSVVLLVGGFGLGLLFQGQKAGVVRAGTGLATESGPQRSLAGAEGSGDSGPMAPRAGTVAGKQDDSKAAVAPTKAGPSAESKQLEALTAQVREMRELMMLSLLQNPAASERLRAVSYTSEIGAVNPKIAAALLATLNSDPNVNVRLTTLEALTHFARDPAVREGLIQSILQQDSPLMQAALADVMLKLQEKRAIQPFKKLLQQKGLNEMVKTKVEQTILQLS